MDELPSQPHPRRSRFNWAAAFTCTILILTLFGAYVFYVVQSLPVRTAQSVRDAFSEIAHLQPKVTVKDRVIFEQATSMLELAVVSRDTQVERETEQSWLGSKQRIKLRGTYAVRAGFDLRKPFNVRIEDKRIVAEVPPPRILSVDQQEIEVLALENGFWNKVQPADIENELRTLPLMARQKASEAGLQKEAIDKLTEQLRAKLGAQYEIDVQIVVPPREIPERRD